MDIGEKGVSRLIILLVNKFKSKVSMPSTQTKTIMVNYFPQGKLLMKILWPFILFRYWIIFINFSCDWHSLTFTFTLSCAFFNMHCGGANHIWWIKLCCADTRISSLQLTIYSNISNASGGLFFTHSVICIYVKTPTTELSINFDWYHPISFFSESLLYTVHASIITGQ